MQRKYIVLLIVSWFFVIAGVSAQTTLTVTNIGGGSNPQMCTLAGDPFNVQIQFQFDQRFNNLSNVSADTIVGNLTISSPGLTGNQYQVTYFIDRSDTNTTLAYKFKKLDILPEFVFGVLHVNQRSAHAFNATTASTPVVVQIQKEQLNTTIYVQGLAINARELVLSDGYKIILPSALPLPPQQNFVALWNFDEGAGTITKDSSGNGNTGTLLSGVTWTADSISGYAVEFDGVDDKISVVKTPSVDLVNEVTLEAWVKRKSNTGGTIISRNGPFYLAVRNNKIWGGIYANAGSGNQWTEFGGSTLLQQNVWYKLKLTYDSSNINLYVNDILDGSISKQGTMPIISQQVWIGWGEPGQDQYFTGILDDVKIYNSTKK